jgi:MFS family permease
LGTPSSGSVTPVSTRDVIWPVIPLLAGVSLLMGATGLQSSLVALRATAEGFPSVLVGLIASAYFLGFLVGARLSATWIGRVGHVRAFGAFASMASVMVLTHVLAVSVPVWVVARFLSGICLSGLVVIIESWLNSSAPRDLRGRVLSTYMTVNLGGYAVGQFLLPVAPVESFELFAIVSVLLSLALLPVTLSRRSNPAVVTISSMPVRSLVGRAPVGVVASAMAGLTWGAISGDAPVVASQAGLRGLSLTLFVSAFLVGHLACEGLIGSLSDRLDRRVVTLVVAASSTALCVVAALLSGLPAALVPLGVAIGGTTLPLYSLSIALAGDRLATDEMVAASGTLVRINGLGAAAGPLLASTVMTSPLGVPGFYLLVASGTTVVVLTAGALLMRDGTLAPQVPYVRAAARATTTVTRSVLRGSASVRERREVRRAEKRAVRHGRRIEPSARQSERPRPERPGRVRRTDRSSARTDDRSG